MSALLQGMLCSCPAGRPPAATAAWAAGWELTCMFMPFQAGQLHHSMATTARGEGGCQLGSCRLYKSCLNGGRYRAGVQEQPHLLQEHGLLWPQQ